MRLGKAQPGIDYDKNQTPFIEKHFTISRDRQNLFYHFHFGSPGYIFETYIDFIGGFSFPSPFFFSGFDSFTGQFVKIRKKQSK